MCSLIQTLIKHTRPLLIIVCTVFSDIFGKSELIPSFFLTQTAAGFLVLCGIVIVEIQVLELWLVLSCQLCRQRNIWND